MKRQDRYFRGVTGRAIQSRAAWSLAALLTLAGCGSAPEPSGSDKPVAVVNEKEPGAASPALKSGEKPRTHAPGIAEEPHEADETTPFLAAADAPLTASLAGVPAPETDETTPAVATATPGAPLIITPAPRTELPGADVRRALSEANVDFLERLPEDQAELIKAKVNELELSYQNFRPLTDHEQHALEQHQETLKNAVDEAAKAPNREEFRRRIARVNELLAGLEADMAGLAVP
jgi:hypothetical protein